LTWRVAVLAIVMSFGVGSWPVLRPDNPMISQSSPKVNGLPWVFLGIDPGANGYILKAREVCEMAKKKTAPMESADSRAIVVSMKGTVEFRDWLNEVAEFDRSTAVQVMEKGAVEYAKKIGFPKPAPKRTGGR
jgi:hypothetical protein